MQYYDITVAANGRQLVEAPGSFLYYLNGNAGGADSTIKVTLGLGGTSVLLKPGQSIRLPANVKPIDTWRIENYANAQTILGQVLVGMGDFHDSNVTGTVQVVDGGKARTLSGAAFMANGQQTAISAQYALVQLWNAPGSQKNLVVEAIAINSSTAQQIGYGFASSAYTTAGGWGVAKKAGSQASAASRIFYQTQAAAPWTTNTGMGVITVPALQTVEKSLHEPIVVAPGYGIAAWASVVNTDLNATFEYFEESQ